MRSKKKLDEMVLGLLILRMGQGWTQADLARRAGTSASVISEYETGKRRLSFDRLSRIAEAAGLPGAAERLLPYLRVLRVLLDKGSSQDRDPVAVTEGVLHGMAARTVDVLTALRRRGEAPPSPADRQDALALWTRLQSFNLNMEDRRILIECAKEYQSWALCELLCKLSTEAGAEEGMAELALFVAERVPGEEAWRSRVQGYAWAYMGLARQARGDESGAEEVFAYARRLWEEGAGGDPGGLLAQPPF
ncbi:MAG TPA: helix-turn-helix transcriptional regulator [Thermoanaerobaculia bacterium]|nr:helix-turn-helix transcriptional regulator [Thermoanaerobaculia bacterium]